MAATEVAGPADLLALVGHELGVTDWLVIDQDRVDQFADATGDHQWIHVDPERAASGPFGATIAHGYLTLALVNYFLPQLLVVRNASMGVNYGLDKVRFPSPVRVGSRVRAHGVVQTADPIEGGVQVVVAVTVAIDGEDRPACVAETVSRFLA